MTHHRNARGTVRAIPALGATGVKARTLLFRAVAAVWRRPAVTTVVVVATAAGRRASEPAAAVEVHVTVTTAGPRPAEQRRAEKPRAAAAVVNSGNQRVRPAGRHLRVVHPSGSDR